MLCSAIWIVVVCPTSSVTALGAAVRVKFEEETIVSGVDVVALWPLTVTVIGPVAAPEGITNDRLFELALETGAGIVPPPCRLSVTCGVVPLAVKPLPVIVTSAPIAADAGLKLVIAGAEA